MCTCRYHGALVEVREHLAEAGSFLLLCGTWRPACQLGTFTESVHQPSTLVFETKFLTEPGAYQFH